MTAAKANSGPARQIHLHIEKHSDMGAVFDVTPKRLADARARHPDVDMQLRITTGLDGKNLKKNLRTADVFFTWHVNNRETFVEDAPNVRWVIAHGAGVSHLMPLDWLRPGAVLTNSAGVHGERAAEYAIMAVLMLNNRVPEMAKNQARARWDQLYNTEVAGKTLLIVGVGSVGSLAARHAKHFGMHVIGVRRSGKKRPFVDEMVTPDKLRKVLPRADFLLMCAPDTAASHHMIAAPELNLMKKGAGLINYSRSGVIDYGALRKKLVKGELVAILDVFDAEPLPKSSVLWKTPNLLITPHSSSDDWDLYTPKTLDLMFENMGRFLAGKKLKNVVDPKLQY